MRHLGLSASFWVNVIKSDAANYGRTNSQTCSIGRPVNQVTKTDCILSSSLSKVAKRCEGKSNCVVPATNTEFTDPCYGTYKYLEVSYTCIPRLKRPVWFGELEIHSVSYGRRDSTTCSLERPESQLRNVACSALVPFNGTPYK
ncbi:L-rhamnose-binding lectin CSL3-like [Aplochiton taeniatus]